MCRRTLTGGRTVLARSRRRRPCRPGRLTGRARGRGGDPTRSGDAGSDHGEQRATSGSTIRLTGRRARPRRIVCRPARGARPARVRDLRRERRVRRGAVRPSRRPGAEPCRDAHRRRNVQPRRGATDARGHARRRTRPRAVDLGRSLPGRARRSRGLGDRDQPEPVGAVRQSPPASEQTLGPRSVRPPARRAGRPAFRQARQQLAVQIMHPSKRTKGSRARPGGAPATSGVRRTTARRLARAGRARENRRA